MDSILGKKTNILQIRLRSKDRVHPRKERILTEPQHALGAYGPGANSVACGNSSARGPGEESLPAKICKKFDARVNF